MRLALVSAPGTPTVTNLSFWHLRALGTLKIGIFSEKGFILTARMFPDVKHTIYCFFVKLFSGVQPWVQLEVSGLRFQVSGIRYQVSGLGSRVSGLRYGASTPPGLSIKGG